MTTTSYQHRVKNANARLRNAENIEAPEDAQINAIMAVAEATLAAAEQQRLANIIALGEPRKFYGEATVSVPTWDVHGVLRPEIAEGLGLA